MPGLPLHPQTPPPVTAFSPDDDRARLAGIVDSAMDAIISTNEAQEIIVFNRAAQQMFGYTSEQILGHPLNDLLPEKYRAGHTRHMRRFGETGETARGMGNLGRLWAQRADGSQFPIEASISQLETSAGRIYTVILRDMTARVRAEEELLERGIRLQQAADENARLYNQAEVRLNFLNALRTIDLAITSSLDLTMVLTIVLDQVLTQLKCDAADFLLFHPGKQCLEYVAGRGFHATRRTGRDLGCAESVAVSRSIVQMPNLAREDLAPELQQYFQAEKIQSAFAAPLIAKGQMQGVLEVFRRSPFAPEAEWIEKLQALAGQAAIAIESSRLFGELQSSNDQLIQAYDATIEGWARALDLRDHETEGHTRRVTEMTLKLAEASGKFNSEDLRHIRWGCLLHDIGKMGVPDEILFNPGKLSDDERSRMKTHPEMAYQLLKPIAYLRKALNIPRYHHEQWDGQGYPYGLKGDLIPPEVRLFTVVDVSDALAEQRRYHASWSDEEIIEYLNRNAGTIFDPEAVAIFLKVFYPDRLS